MYVDLTPSRASEALCAAGVDGSVVAVERLDGVSNLTWHVRRAGDPPVALRLDRQVGIFQPHNVRQEARVIRAPGPSAIPVLDVLGEAAEHIAAGRSVHCAVVAGSSAYGYVADDQRGRRQLS